MMRIYFQAELPEGGCPAIFLNKMALGLRG